MVATLTCIWHSHTDEIPIFCAALLLGIGSLSLPLGIERAERAIRRGDTKERGGRREGGGRGVAANARQSENTPEKERPRSNSGLQQSWHYHYLMVQCNSQLGVKRAVVGTVSQESMSYSEMGNFNSSLDIS